VARRGQLRRKSVEHDAPATLCVLPPHCEVVETGAGRESRPSTPACGSHPTSPRRSTRLRRGGSAPQSRAWDGRHEAARRRVPRLGVGGPRAGGPGRRPLRRRTALGPFPTARPTVRRPRHGTGHGAASTRLLRAAVGGEPSDLLRRPDVVVPRGGSDVGRAPRRAPRSARRQPRGTPLAVTSGPPSRRGRTGGPRARRARPARPSSRRGRRLAAHSVHALHG
jgi:hypothetical protein